jgi:hypothetical protein
VTTYEKAEVVLEHMKRNSLIGEETYLVRFSVNHFSIVIFDLCGTLCGNVIVENEVTFGKLAHAIAEVLEDASD